MEDRLGSIIAIIFGACLIAFFKKFAQLAAVWQKKLFNINYDETTTKRVGITFLIFGVGFIILGIIKLNSM